MSSYLVKGSQSRMLSYASVGKRSSHLFALVHTYIHTHTHTHMHTVLPGSPSELTLLLSSYHTLTITLQLSSEGTSPILGLLVEFSSHSNMVRNISGPFTAGELVEVTVDGLDDGTTYAFTMAAYNFGGRGAASSELEGTTGECVLGV